MLRVKLKYLDGWTESRRRNAETYRRLLREAVLVLDEWDGGPLDGRGGFVLPHDAGYGHHIYNQFIIRADWRDELMAHLKDCRIGTEVYYPVPMHLQECFAGLGYEREDFPASERAADETLALPIYPELTREMISRVVSELAEFAAGREPGLDRRN